MPQTMSRSKICLFLCLMNFAGIALMESVFEGNIFFRWLVLLVAAFTVFYAARNLYLLRKGK